MSNIRILVIDDEEGMRLGCKRVLDKRGYDVITAATGGEGIRLLQEAAPDLALVDYKLPDIDGMQILEEVRGQQMRTLCIMITAYATLESAVAATKKGAYDFLAKPFTPAELNAAVDKAVEYIRLQQEAERLKEEKKRVRLEFVRIVSHELKAPLAAIEGYLTNLLDGYVGDDVETRTRILQRCKARAEGMRKLILDLLDLTRIESGSKERHLEQVDLIELLGDIIEVYDPQAKERSIAIDFAHDEKGAIEADSGEMRIIFTNLVSNAIKYNRDEGSVTVRLQKADEGRISISVSDTGIGLRDQDKQKLFTEFYRAHTAETKAIPGTGLGLSIVKKLVELNGGTISFDSEHGKGTTFNVILPVMQPTPEE